MPTSKTPIRESGYQDLRDYIEDNWTYVELRDDEDESITRIDVDADERASWAHNSGDQALRVELELTASDDDINADSENPVTIVATASYAVEVDGDEKSWDETHPVTFAEATDEVVMTHSIEVPEVE